MSNEMKNKEYYRNTFDEVHASENLLRKVKTMKFDSKDSKITLLSKAAKIGYSMAALLAVFALTNVATYAATGETWVEKVYVNVAINDQTQEVEMYKCTDDNGDEYYFTELEAENGSQYSFAISEDSLDDSDFEFNIDSTPDAAIVTDNDKVYISVEDQMIDITDEIADGYCKGTFEICGIEYTYTVTGNADEYSLSIDSDSLNTESAE